MPATAQTSSIASGETKTYIVQLADSPLATYDGGIRGIPATKPGSGDKVDVQSTAADRYTSYLTTQRSEVLEAAGADTDAVVTTYEVALNGFAADLTPAQVAQLRKSDRVVNVWENEERQLDTVSTPDYLGMTGEDGVWETQFGGPEGAGEGVVVGVIDTGIDPDNPSFAGSGGEIPEEFAEACEVGPNDPAFECNDKLVGARYYRQSGTVVPSEILSPRDRNGHGSHTAGTAAGNFDVPMSINGVDLGNGSGMAPAAQIISYKGLWDNGQSGGSGFTVDLVDAIDDAVADGVDVINYSVSGSSTSIVGPDEIAFLNAANAGVFVSTSAGNSGDTVGVSSVAHNAPWTTTVAASTHDRGATKTVTLGDDSTYQGVGVGDAVGPLPLVDSSDAALEGVSQQAADQCWLDADTATEGVQPVLDPAIVEGSIVLCDRGTVDRVAKSASVEAAGGLGMIQANNTQAESLNADFHAVPSIHVDSVAGDAIEAYAATPEPTATISAQSTDPVVAPEMAGFSSYGPALAGGGDLLKPDITAPGVDVVAAYDANSETGEPEFNSISGTSMSAPHIAGLGALLKGKNPEWSPAAIKSSMMTTASTLNTAGDPIQRGGEDATALDYGSGEVVPGDSYDPGLVYDSDIVDWASYACDIDQWELAFSAPTCDSLPEVDASDLNYPSIAIGDLAGAQTITRTVTSVSDTTETYTVAANAPEGIAAVVTPATFTIAPGETATYTVDMTRTTAALGEYTFGDITWTSDNHEVRSPIAVQPVAIAAPDEITGTGVSGDRDVDVTPGFTGVLDTDVDGLVPSEVQTKDVSQNPDPTRIDDAIYQFTVPEGTTVVRYATYDSEVGEGTDVDLYLANAEGEIIAESLGGSSEESVTLENPPAGDYIVAIDNFSGPSPLTVPVHGFFVNGDDAGNLTVDPANGPVVQGETSTLNVAWDGLEADSRYLGAVNYLDEGDVAGSTLVSIETGAADPTVTRLGGEDRYETASLIAGLYDTADVDTVFIASGQTFADALSGSSPAATSSVPGTMETSAVAAPVLLTRVGALPGTTKATLDQLDPENIVVLGGPDVVSDAVLEELDGYADEVVRIGGVNRYGTSAMIAALYGEDVDTVYVASGENDNFADSLSAGALAGTEGAPVLLTRGDRVDVRTANALEALNAENVVVIGGPEAVSGDVYTAIGATERLAGNDRYGTSIKVSQQFPADLPAAHVASGLDYPDALAGGANAGYLGVPVLLSRQGAVPDGVITELDRISPALLGVLGGTTALSQDVEDQLNERFPAWAAE